MDREENPKEFYEALIESGIEVYVSTVEHPSEVPEMLLELGQLLNLAPKAKELADAINAELATTFETGPTVLPMIWHDPLMAVSPTKYAGALLECCGFNVPDIEPEGTATRSLHLKPSKFTMLRVCCYRASHMSFQNKKER